MGRTIDLGPVSDLKDTQRRVFEVEGRSILVCQTNSGVFALENRCTHQDSPLAEGRIKGTFIFCPLHGVRFDLRSGAPIGELTTTPVPTYPAAIVGDRIEITLGDAPEPRRALF